jgi:hypothetical protein
VYTHDIQDVTEVTEDRGDEDRVATDYMQDDGDGGEQGASPVESETEEESEPRITYNQTQIRYVTELFVIKLYIIPVWRIRDVYPGSRIRLFSIPDPGSSSKNLSILTLKKAKKWFLSSKKYDPGCSSRIPDLDADFLPSRIQGSKRHPIPDPDPQHCIIRTVSLVSLW